MKIFNKSKTKELTRDSVDMSKGYLEQDRMLIKHHKEQQEIQEQSHQELIEDYSALGGGKVYKTIIDVPYQAYKEAYDEYEDVLVYIEYTAKDFVEIDIQNLKEMLNTTDWIVLKIAEAETEEEKQALRVKYAEQLNNRKWWRAQINSLEIQQKQLTNQ
jgi:hypothetical protein